MAGLLLFNSVISNAGKRWSSTSIIFVALNHVEDRGQQDYISGETRKVSWEGNEIDHKIKYSQVQEFELDPSIYQ